MSSRADLRTARITILTSVAGTYFQIQIVARTHRARPPELEDGDRRAAVRRVRATAPARWVPRIWQGSAPRWPVPRSIIPQLQQQEVEALGALAVLVGQPPEGFTVETLPLDRMTEPAIAAGLPASLLQRRPDLVAGGINLQRRMRIWRPPCALVSSLSSAPAAALANPAVPGGGHYAGRRGLFADGGRRSGTDRVRQRAPARRDPRSGRPRGGTCWANYRVPFFPRSRTSRSRSPKSTI